MISDGCDESSWISCVSNGGLKTPSSKMIETVQKMELQFNKLHGDSLSKSRGVMQRLTDILIPEVSYLNIPNEVLKCLVRTRSFIRLNNLNNVLLYDKKPPKNKKLTKFIK